MQTRMYQQKIQESPRRLAPEPGRKILRFLSGLLIILVANVLIALGTLLLPAQVRDQLNWNHPNVDQLNVAIILSLLSLFTPLLYLAPFMPLPIGATSYKQWKWRILARKRQQALEDHRNNQALRIFALPERPRPFPKAVAIHLCRNWRTTLIGGAVYALLIGAPFLVYAIDCRMNMEYLAQLGELSAWSLLGAMGLLEFCLFLSLPALLAFWLAPRQRLVATQEGLVCHRGLRVSSISWSEALLFAVIAEHKDIVVCELSSQSSVIRWASKPAGTYGDFFPFATIGVAPLAMVKAEYSIEDYQQQITLLTLIVADRTSLSLYDLR